MRSSLSDSTPASVRRGTALALAIMAPLFLGGCVTGLAGAAGMALNAISGGGSGETGSSTARQNGPFDANSPRDLQDALAQTDDKATPLCRQRLRAYQRAQGSAQHSEQEAIPTPAASPPPRRCGLQALCLPGADRPTEMMVCRNQAAGSSQPSPQLPSE